MLLSLQNNRFRKRDVLSKINIDSWSLVLIFLISFYSLLIIFSASNENPRVVEKQVINIVISFFGMSFLALLSPVTIRIWVPRTFLLALITLALVPLVGSTSMGAKRWLNLYFVRFQPSELMKVVMPLMIAWVVYKFGMPRDFKRLSCYFLIILIPTGLTLIQPDLGTAILICLSGVYVLFAAGLSWRVIVVALVSMASLSPFAWAFLHGYQKQRILTLFNPESDPLGSGYHIIQSKIAIGSGGVDGVGWLNGTQSHLGFIPEQKTDFIFAVLSEEFGMKGFLILMLMYCLLIGRSFFLTLKMKDMFGRLASLGIIMIFVSYVFVNIGMVSGILPVVGVPLPLISYGGTSMLTIMCGFGLISAFYKNDQF